MLEVQFLIISWSFKMEQQPFRKPEETLKVIEQEEHVRKQKKPTKVDVTKKRPKRVPRKAPLKQGTTLVVDLLEHTNKPKREDVPDSEVAQLFEGTTVVTPSLVQDIAVIEEPEHSEVMTDQELVKATDATERFDKLMKYYMTEFPWQIDGPVDLAFLEQHVAPYMDGKINSFPLKPREVFVSEKDKDTYYNPYHDFPPECWPAKKETSIPCPFHQDTLLNKIDNQAYCDKRYLKCPIPSCPVWCTEENASVVLMKLVMNTHDEVRHRIQSFSPLQCKCALTPKMGVSKITKNFERVFLSCGRNQSGQPCRYFQWMDVPLWKTKRPLEPTHFGVRDQAFLFGQKCPRMEQQKPVGSMRENPLPMSVDAE